MSSYPAPLTAAVTSAIETLYLASPRSPRAVEARNNPERYCELYCGVILGSPLAAIPVAVDRIVKTEDHFPSPARFRAEVLAVAKSQNAPDRWQMPRAEPPSDRAEHCCGSEYAFRSFRAPLIRLGQPVVDEAGEPRFHEYARNICDCQVERRIERGEELLGG